MNVGRKVRSVSGAMLAISVVFASTSSAALANVTKEQRKQIEDQLSDFGETLKRINHAASELHSEVNRHQQVVTGPDVLDAAVMDGWGSASPGLYPGGGGWVNTEPGPALPPRKRFLDLSCAQLAQTMPLFDTDTGAINKFSQQFSSDDKLRAQIGVLNDECNEIDSLNTKMVSLTKAPPYDNKAISITAEDMRDQTESINATRRHVMKLLGRDDK